MSDIIICSLQGCLSDSRHRIKYYPDEMRTWLNKFKDDSVNIEVLNAINGLIQSSKDTKCVIVSSMCETNHNLILDWLMTKITQDLLPQRLLLSPSNFHDNKPSLKKYFLDVLISEGHKPILAIDSLAATCAMYRRYDIPTFHYKNTP